MAGVNQIVAAVAATIKEYNADSVHVYDSVRKMNEFPAIMVQPAQAGFTEAFSAGDDKWIYRIFVICKEGADVANAQARLNDLVDGWGPKSIRQILHEHYDLGLSDGTQVFATAMGGYSGKFETQTVECVGAFINVLVHTDPRERSD